MVAHIQSWVADWEEKGVEARGCGRVDAERVCLLLSESPYPEATVFPHNLENFIELVARPDHLLHRGGSIIAGHSLKHCPALIHQRSTRPLFPGRKTQSFVPSSYFPQNRPFILLGVERAEWTSILGARATFSRAPQLLSHGSSPVVVQPVIAKVLGKLSRYMTEAHSQNCQKSDGVSPRLLPAYSQTLVNEFLRYARASVCHPVPSRRRSLQEICSREVQTWETFSATRLRVAVGVSPVGRGM